MLQDKHGIIDYSEQGTGPTIVFVPGSWATGSDWSGIIEALDNRFRAVTTSLPGYGGTRESRTADGCSIDRSSETVEAVIRRAGGPVHLVGHSYGALICLDVALCGLMPLMSLTLIEPVAFGLLRQAGDLAHYEQWTALRDKYMRSFDAGEREAARYVFDYLGSPGGFDALPPRMREHVLDRTPSHILDMCSGFDPSIAGLANILLPTRIVRGARTASSLYKCADILSRAMPNASLHTVEEAGHFMTATHAAELAGLVRDHVKNTESLAWADLSFASPFGLGSRTCI
ncbi:alpha/beta fold hydrolase [Bradyrhizobium yuanmingense]|uniref:alpha/beta fold hydrolase n=1 Tax=Bradyrhizobium yuanmingense TaxID=108015 RepID=UPI0023B959D5|nr:alpha/beta hydrolase [Bradyrhizobium yuanmingense]MDF0579844.1 alpha/beta hydrolase [Bradyrhizobium yuanmingense]